MDVKKLINNYFTEYKEGFTHRELHQLLDNFSEETKNSRVRSVKRVYWNYKRRQRTYI